MNMGGHQVIDIVTILGRDISLMVDSFIFSCRAKNLSIRTIAFYEEKLKYLFDYCRLVGKSVHQIEKIDIQRYIISLCDKKLAPTTINGTIKVWSQFYGFINEEGMTDNNPMADIDVLRAESTVKSVITREQFFRILSKIHPTSFHGARNLAMFMFAWETMARLSEFTQLDLENIHLHAKEESYAVFKAETSKARRDRMGIFSTRTAQHIVNYISQYRRKIPGDLLFCTQYGQPLERRNVERIFERAGNKVGIKKFGPQMVRRSAASIMVEETGNVRAVQYQLGHKSSRTTENFYLSCENAKHFLLTTYRDYSPLYGKKL